MSATNSPHNFSGYLPAIKIAPGLSIPTYFVIISLTFCICLFWLVRRAERRALSRNTALDISLALMIAGFLGSRLVHIVVEEPAYYFESLSRVFEIWKGGFVWYGGAIAGAASGLFLLKRRREKLGVWLDLFAPLAAFGYALGRVACLLEGCCYGGVCTLASGYSFRYPTQAFAVIWELAALGILLKIEAVRFAGKSPSWLRADGALFGLWLVLHSVGRIIMESFRADPRGPTLLHLSLSTWLSLAVLFTAITYLRRLKR